MELTLEEERNKIFLQNIDQFIGEVICVLMQKEPKDPIPFMVDWLIKKTRYTTLSQSETEEKKVLQKEVQRIQKLIAQQIQEKQVVQEEKPKIQQFRRQSNLGNIRDIYQQVENEAENKKIYPKTMETKQYIKSLLSKIFIFQDLSQQDLKLVIDYMQEKIEKKGTVIIQQGEEESCLYVVGKGKLSCIRQYPGETEERDIKVYTAGEFFGELALLYNTPRQTTITALEQCTLYSLDKEHFNKIVKNYIMKKRLLYETFLLQVPILKDLNLSEIEKINDILIPFSFHEGEIIIEEGDQGDLFFILESGTAIATKQLEQGKPPQQVKSYKSGDYFGELSLLLNQPRSANIISTVSLQLKSECKCLGIDRTSFKRTLGSLEYILRKNIPNYKHIDN